jgi:hypothetical protein
MENNIKNPGIRPWKLTCNIVEMVQEIFLISKWERHLLRNSDFNKKLVQPQYGSEDVAVSFIFFFKLPLFIGRRTQREQRLLTLRLCTSFEQPFSLGKRKTTVDVWSSDQDTMKISSLAEFVIKISIEYKPGTGISSVFL